MTANPFPKVLIYTFFNPRHISHQILSSLDSNRINKFFLGNLKYLSTNILKNNYDYILGLGDYRIGTKNIRIETIFNSKEESLPRTWILPTKENIILSTKPGTGPCNRSSYLSLDTIKKNNLSTKFAFVHIPRDFNFPQALNYINSVILDIYPKDN